MSPFGDTHFRRAGNEGAHDGVLAFVVASEDGKGVMMARIGDQT